jgi:hypothetical protein
MIAWRPEALINYRKSRLPPREFERDRAPMSALQGERDPQQRKWLRPTGSHLFNSSMCSGPRGSGS